MKLQLVTFEQAQSLKELGFPDDISYQVCPYCYFGKDLIDIQNDDVSILNPKWRKVKDENICLAPTLELTAKWLRESKKILITIDVYCDCTTKYIMHYHARLSYIRDNMKIPVDNCIRDICRLKEQLTYEEALSAGIDKAIEILKKENKYGDGLDRWRNCR